MKTMLMAVAVVLSAALGYQIPAQASVFKFNYQGADVTDITSGSIITGPLSPTGPVYSPSSPITGITGTYNGAPITGLTTFQNADNTLYHSAHQSFDYIPLLDYRGLSFSTAMTQVNLFHDPSQQVDYGPYSDLASSNGQPAARVSSGNLMVTPAAVAAVPEPSSFGLFGMGVFAIGLSFWARKKQVVKKHPSSVRVV